MAASPVHNRAKISGLQHFLRSFGRLGRCSKGVSGPEAISDHSNGRSTGWRLGLGLSQSPWRSIHDRLIDVFVDIDDTLVYPGISFRVAGFAACYRLAHGALEFLVALDGIPNLRINFFSAGSPPRNVALIKQLMDEVVNVTQRRIGKYDVFSVCEGEYGKKKLKGVKKGINLERAVLIDDRGKYTEGGEERNLLKVYENVSHLADDSWLSLTRAERVFKLRLKNNLVRALGMILSSMTAAHNSHCTLVEALNTLQWDGERYRHEETNARELYDLGLAAMRQVNPDFQLVQEETAIGELDVVYPWSAYEPDENLFPHKNIFSVTLF